MKTIRIILLALIILGVALLLTQKFWVPPLVSTILTYEGVSQSPDIPDDIPVVPHVSLDGMENWNWILSEISPQGTQFLYPHPLPTRFVTAENWPPQVELEAEEFSCIEGDVVAQDGSPKRLERHMVGDVVFCVAITREGAAGSTYTKYEYSTEQGDFVAHVTFTLRTPQCMNYDEPEQSACTAEQTSFNTDALADRIASSIRMQ